jgi:hypothetical protein
VPEQEGLSVNRRDLLEQEEYLIRRLALCEQESISEHARTRC